MLFILLAAATVVAHAHDDDGFLCRKCGREISWTSNLMRSVPDEMIHENSVRVSIRANNEEIEGASVSVAGNYKNVIYFENAKNVNIKKVVDKSMSNGPLDWKRVTCSQCSNFLGWALDDLSEKRYRSEENDEDMNDGDKGKIGEKCIRADDLPQDTCASIKVGYWYILWCHRRTVQQMHLDTRQKPDSIFSLGTYSQVNSYEMDEQEDDVFLNGQICDETGTSRMTTVHFECCSDNDYLKENLLSIRSFEEPELCRYKIVVCLPNYGSSSLSTTTTTSTNDEKKCSLENIQSCTLNNKGDNTHYSHRNLRYAFISSKLVSNQEISWIEKSKPLDSL